jgi:tetratricopeptide (TPR) repeat protein
MIFPLFFILFLFSIYYLEDSFSYSKSIQLFLPLALLFGFSINYSINHVINNFNQNKRYKIIFLSIFILPLPVLILVNFITYTNKMYFSFLLGVSVFNILIPLFFLLKSNIKLKNKIVYSIISLLFIPAYIIFQSHFKIELNSSPFIPFNKTDSAKNIGAVFYKNKKIIFKGSDCRNKNLEKSLLPSLIYSFIGEKSLIIDGYRGFYDNKISKFFNDVTLQNPNLLVNTGFYNKNISEMIKNPVLFYFQNNNKYAVITDILNLIDQKKNYYRSSEDYYLLVEKHLKKEGVFIQIFDIYESNADFLSIALRNLNNIFKESIVYQFSNQLVVISSNDKNILEIDDNKYNLLLKIFKENNYINSLFIDEIHFLSHFISNGIEDLLFYLPKSEKYERLSNNKDKPVKWEADFFKIFTFKSDNFFQIFNQLDKKIEKKIKSIFKKNVEIIKVIKGVELAGSLNLYEECAEKLIELKKIRKNLRDKKNINYIDQILRNMKNYYYSTAFNFEKNKNWLDAKRVYKLIFVIDKKNFDVVYRLGLLSITLQDINSSFEYFLQAMKLKKNDPKVLYQIGALYFSVGNNDEAIKYLKESNQYGEKTSQLYLYLGLSYEKNNDLGKAKNYYEMALKIDPKDSKIIEKLDNVERLILEEKSKWRFTPNTNSDIDAEQGEDIALPINKSALEKRMPPENENSKKPKQKKINNDVR